MSVVVDDLRDSSQHVTKLARLCFMFDIPDNGVWLLEARENQPSSTRTKIPDISLLCEYSRQLK